MCVCVDPQDSALFWHYALRHVPSDSLICARDDLASGSTSMLRKNSTLHFQATKELLAKDPALGNQSPKSGYPLYGYGAFPLGSSAGGCLCGWPLTAMTGQKYSMCEVPWPSICAAISRNLTRTASGWMCAYEQTQADAVERQILAAWQPEWPCYDMDLSDAWGIIPGSTDAENWMKISSATAFESSLAHVMYSGRAGLRIGNMQTLYNASKSVMGPSLSARQQAQAAAQKKCESNIFKTFDPLSVARDVADDLIPSSQAVSTESMPVSVCLRFSIEYLRLRVLLTLQSSEFLMVGAGRGSEILQASKLQQATVQSWKHKCESQLGMVAVCQSNSIFDMIPATENAYKCPFTISDSYSVKSF